VKRNLKERKQKDGLQGRGEMTCCNGHRETSITTLKHWERTGSTVHATSSQQTVMHYSTEVLNQHYTLNHKKREFYLW